MAPILIKTPNSTRRLIEPESYWLKDLTDRQLADKTFKGEITTAQINELEFRGLLRPGMRIEDVYLEIDKRNTK